MSTPSPFAVPIPSLPSFNNTLGPMYLAVVFISMLFGITTVQAFVYHQNCARDPLALKLMILALWLCDCVQVALAIHFGWYYSVQNFANPLALPKIVWSLTLYSLLGTFSDSIVNCLLAWKLWRLSPRSGWLITLVAVPTLMSIAGTFALATNSFRMPFFEKLQHDYTWTWYLIFVPHTFANIVISLSLVVNLIKKHTGFRRSSSLIRLLVVYIVNSCFLVSATAILSVVLYVGSPHTLWFGTAGAVLTKLMLNSLLGLLNTKEFWKKQVYGGPEPMSIHLSRLPVDSEAQSGPESEERGLKVNIIHTKETHHTT
ncbi:hypothetical protein BDW22DRAFT_1357493 [Trametopsis cervina]|nr:hypothetical protein BDW22DRAFT_1357493 [Trametopsis cervina]